MNPSSDGVGPRRLRAVSDERGMGVVLALIIIVVAFIVAGSWVQFGTHQVEASSYQRRREQAFHASEAGLNLAINELRTLDTYTGTGPTGPTGVVNLADDTGQYEVAVTNVVVAAGEFPRKRIIARGYAPSKTAVNRIERQIVQEVEVIPLDQFSYSLFTTGALALPDGGGVSADESVYARGNVTIGTQNVVGDVQSRGSITQAARSVSRSLHALGAVTINNGTSTTKTKVLANVRAGDTAGGGENITASGFTNSSPYVQVVGSAQASGLILPLPSSVAPLMPNFVVGARVPSTPPPPPPDLLFPEFTDPEGWTAVKNEFGVGNWWEWAATSGASGFNTYWDESVDSFRGAHRIWCGSGGPAAGTCGTVTFAPRWFTTEALVGNTLIYTNRPVDLRSDIRNLNVGSTRTLVVISTFASAGNCSSGTPAITVGKSSFIAKSVEFNDLNVLLFAPNGGVCIKKSEGFKGAIYSNAINIADTSLTLTYSSVDTVGFKWNDTSASHFDVRSLTFQEVPFVEP